MNKNEKEQFALVQQRLESGELIEQPCWSFIEELNSYSRERLESVAFRDGYRTYTYRQMFRYWEKYAEVFSGLNMTGENHSRVAIVSTPLPESVFAIYGLNMTGASVSQIYHFDLYDENQFYSMVEREKITDLIVSELFAFPRLMKRLLRDKELLGLNHIIVLQSPMGGDYAIPALEIVRNMNRELFHEMPDGLLMEDLLQQYEGTPITYGQGQSDIILHTTGTVSGMHKPVPLTDRALNAFVVSALKAKDTYEDFKKAPKHMVTYLTLNTAWVYAMVDMLHTPLGLGMEIVSLPVGATNPRYAEAIQEYGVNVLFTSMGILDSWLKTLPDINLSKLKIVFMGGTYVSPEFKKQFNNYLRSCGSPARIINGYGLSELGGACLLCPSNRDDDAIGFPLPGFKVKIFVEDENRCYDISDGPRTGLLLLSSPTMSSGRLDDEVFFETEKIDGVDYINTNDKVRVNEDGSLTCIGRSNQFFVNNAGIRFDAGLVQTALTAQPGIAACGLAPEFHKTFHDNIPVLYVEMREKGAGSLTVLRQALIQVFIRDEKLEDTNLPGQVVFVEDIPLNSSGKVDLKKLASGTVKGTRYSIRPVKLDGKVVDILLVPAVEGENATVGAGVPEELENDPYNILSEVFAVIPDLNKGRISKLFQIPGLRELVIKLTDFDINNIPNSLRNATPKMINLAFNKYMMPLMKGVNNMSKSKQFPNGVFPMFQGMMPNFPSMPSMPNFPVMPMMPMMPPFPFAQGKNGFGWCGNDNTGDNAYAEDFKSGLIKFWKQTIDAQKASLDGTRDQWSQFIEYSMDMWDTFAEFLPDEVPVLPGLPTVSPKNVVKRAKEFQELANEHIQQQADTAVDFVIKGQEQACDMVAAAVEKVQEKKEEPVQAEEEEAPAQSEKKARPAPTAKKAKPVPRARNNKPAQAEKDEAPAQAEANPSSEAPADQQ